ncbi:MAG: hypothetical protein QXY45_01995 [Candidatus Aenigmatarchaeota archaeon]
MGYTIYFPDNLANYNLGIATVFGLIIIFLFVGIIIGFSRGRRSRRTPE